MKTAVLYRTHFVDEVIRREFAKLSRDCGELARTHVFLLMDVTEHSAPSDIKSTVPFTHEDMSNLGYSFSSMMDNCEYPALFFFRRFPDYDHYWLIDYDVRFTGSWETFLGSFSGTDGYDLLGARVETPAENPSWSHWSESSVEFKRPLRIFYSVTRFSRAALDCLDTAYRSGISGFVELVSPSVLHEAGLRVGDFYGFPHYRPQHVKQCFYTSETFRWRPPHAEAGPLPDMLYHPIKEMAVATHGT